MAGSVGSEEGDFGFQIAPMVDVVFVLLLFFMACAGLQVAEIELSINLPSGAVSTQQVVKTPIIIDISADGSIVANSRQYDSPTSRELPELEAFLENAVGQFGGEDPVIIRPAMETRHERVMDVLNVAAKAKVKNLTFS